MMALLLVALCSLSFALSGSAQQSSGFKVIVHEDVEEQSLSRKQISDMFLRRKQTWADGLEVRPAELAPTARTRELFSEAVHGRPATAVKSYWLRAVFSGRESPPPEFDTDAEVIDFVRRTPGAIGYVGANTRVDAGVRILDMR